VGLSLQNAPESQAQKDFKAAQHRKNRIMAKKLDDVHVRLSGWDVI